jgi:protein-tyrosine-phosphatase
MQRKAKSVISMLLIVAFCAANQLLADDPPTEVVFVCERGVTRSLMAASYFNQIAAERRLQFRAIPRASKDNNGEPSTVVIETLRADGIDVGTFHPTLVTSKDVSSANRVITLSTTLNTNIMTDNKSIEQWNDLPPLGDLNVFGVALKQKVGHLIDELTSTDAK